MYNLRELVKKKRILIIGPPGSGKTSMARKLGSLLGLEVFHLDSFFWKPGWEKVLFLERKDILRNLVEKKQWIIEGNYPDLLDIQIKHAEIVIVLELSRFLCFWHVLIRKVKSMLKPLPDIAPGCPDTLDRKFLMSIWNYPVKDAPIVEMILKHVDKNNAIIRFPTLTSVNKFINSVESVYRN